MYLMLCYYCSKLTIETPKAGYLIFLFPANNRSTRKTREALEKGVKYVQS